MKIIHIHDRLSGQGGADVHLLGILEASPASLHTMALFGRDDHTATEFSHRKGDVRFLKKLDKKAPFSADQRVADRLSGCLAEVKPDVVHVHNILHPLFLWRIADTHPAVITVQDHRFFCPGRGKVRADGRLCRDPFGRACAGCFDDRLYHDRLMELVRDRLDALDRFRAIIVLSQYMKDELVQTGILEEKIHVIPPFVYRLAADPIRPVASRTILFAGRLVWAKGVMDLVNALAGVRGAWSMVVAGAGPMRDSMAKRADQLGLTHRFRFTGWSGRAALNSLYHQARFVVMPSRWQEPFGITGLEAQSLGRPVVAYDTGGIREWLVHDHTGLLVPAGDVEALTASIDVMLADDERVAHMGLNGKSLAARRFDPAGLMDELLGLYERIR